MKSNKLIEQRREKILAYNGKHDCSPLVFMGYGGKIHKIPAEDLKFNLDGSPNKRRLILSILDQSNKWSSFNSTTVKVETTPGRNRSSLDIWRHAKDLYPDIDVFLIMEAIHKLVLSGDVYGQYCCQVHRAVFDIYHHNISDHFWLCREYKISFNSWKQLHTEEVK